MFIKKIVLRKNYATMNMYTVHPYGANAKFLAALGVGFEAVFEERLTEIHSGGTP